MLMEGYLVAGTETQERTMDILLPGRWSIWFQSTGRFDSYRNLEMLKFWLPTKHNNKSSSAGLIEGQTDEADFGVTYKDLDTYIQKEATEDENIVDKVYNSTRHKRENPRIYPN